MSISSICKRQVVTIGRDADVGTAARLMRDEHVGCLIVTSSPGKRPVGVLTDRDIVLNVIARARNPDEITVGEVMTSDPLVADLGADIGDTLKRMREIGVRRMPVVDGQGQLAGIVALDDVIDHLFAQLAAVAGAIRTEQRTERALRS
jgi:CBS domain-containing protein